MRNLKKIFSISFFFILVFPFYGGEALRTLDLSHLEPSWTAVIGGSAVSPAIETSYGIAVLTDGRLLSACTNSGKVIWQKQIKGRPTPYISSFGDFLFAVTDTNKLNMINPSGNVLWTGETPFEIKDVPVSGFDGRVFVRGEKNIACFGLNGVRKWSLKTESLANFKPLVLNDGSVLVFKKNLQKGCQVGIHISPFGKKIDEQPFSGEVTAACSSKKGLLVAVKSNSIGLINVSPSTGKISHRWSYPLPSKTSRCYAACYNEKSGHCAFFIDQGGSTVVYIMDSDKGFLISEIKLGSFNSLDIQIAKSTSTGFLLSDSSFASEFYEDGTILWNARLPDRKNWNYLCYSFSNYLFICQKDWSMLSYRMSQTSLHTESYSTPKTSSYIKLRKINSLNNEYNIKTFSQDDFPSIAKLLSDGDYGEKEKPLLEDIKYEAFNYQTSLNSKERFATKTSYFQENPLYTEQVFKLMALSGTCDFSGLFADMLLNEGNASLSIPLLCCVAEYAFDPEGEMLSALEYILSKTSASDTNLIKTICDATYSICVFMGRPSFNKKGKEILTGLMYPKYSRIINLYARSTLEKMVKTDQSF